MRRLVFVLGSPNGMDGRLSLISLGRIGRAVHAQQNDPAIVLVATGGFGAHFNMSDRPHRDLVHAALIARRAQIDVVGANDFLSSNTVEDAVMIRAFVDARGVSEYGIVTSAFHEARCRFIFGCVAPFHTIEFLAADDPLELDVAVLDHERKALAALVAQQGVVVDGVLHGLGGSPASP